MCNLAGKRCIDVGCGSGLAGVALHRAGAAQAILADGDAGTVHNCARNIHLNGVRGTVIARSLWHAVDDSGAAAACCQMQWEHAVAAVELGEVTGGGPAGAFPCFDVVVASDVLYSPECVRAFVPLLAHLLQAGRPWTPSRASSQGGGLGGEGGGSGTCAYVATMLRQPATFALFLERTAAAGLRLEQVDSDWLGAGQGAVRFQRVHRLKDRSNILLHRITLV